MTTARAWQTREHRPSDGIPIPHADLIAKALVYKEQPVTDAAAPGDGLAREDPQHTASGRWRAVPDQVATTKANPQIYLHGKIIKVPTHLVGTYIPVISNPKYMLFDARDGAESIGFPLPLEARQVTGRKILPGQVRGARIRHPRQSWLQKQHEHAAEHYPGLNGENGGLSTK